ncbi:GNAT family N-acetyltransferase [Undibacterium sp. SXout20W]|uniref:GNAT family N-acetyltransferase n=1 Tax=Undibacterium sp. SXout20W TaxID=3413051 RepID=UPI003BEFF7CE
MGLTATDTHYPIAKVHVYPGFDKLPPGYTNLFQDTEQCRSFFLSLPWFTHLRKSGTDTNTQLRIYVLEQEDVTVPDMAALPMCFYPPTLPFFRLKTLVAFANYYSAIFGPILSEQSNHTAQQQLNLLIKGIGDEKPRWDAIDLHPLEKESACFPMLISAFSHAGMPAKSYFCSGNWFLKVNGRSYQEFFDGLPSKLKNTLKRKSETLRKTKKLELMIASSSEEVSQLISSYQAIYQKSWKTPEPFAEFVPGWIEESARQGWLRLGIAMIDDQPAAAQIWLVHQKKASIYKLAYDEQFSNFSIGSILTAHLFSHVIDIDKVDEVDFLNGDENYKKDWMSDRREYWGIIAYNSQTWKGKIAYYIQNLIRHFKQLKSAKIFRR